MNLEESFTECNVGLRERVTVTYNKVLECQARQCVAGSGYLQGAPERPWHEVEKVKFKLQLRDPKDARDNRTMGIF